MATFSVRISDDLAARFDAVADLVGGRSALLRRQIGAGAAAAVSAPQVPRSPRSGARIMVRLTPSDAAAVDAEAAAMGLPRAGWIAALVRRRVRGVPSFGRADELHLAAIRSEFRRIGVNVNQIARALNTAVMDGRVLDLELSDLKSLRRELRRHLLALREAFEGNLAYWDDEP